MIKVVFIGNSLTYVNDLPAVLVELGKSADPPVVFDTSDKCLKGAATLGYFLQPRTIPNNPALENHILQCSVQMIDEVNADFVVLQSNSVGSQLRGAVPEFWHGLIRPTSAKTVMFMTWGIGEDSNIFDGDALSLQTRYNDIGRFLDVSVAPVGSAWTKHYDESNVSLHSSDNIHPAPAGTYLAALVFYSTLTGQDPRSLGTGGLAIDESLANHLRQIAWETYKENPLADVSSQQTKVPEDDYGNSRDNATPYVIGEILNGSLGPSDADVFKFTVPQDGRVKISVSDGTKELYVNIMDSDGGVIGQSIYSEVGVEIARRSFEKLGNDAVLKHENDYFLRIGGGVNIDPEGGAVNAVSSEYTISSEFYAGPDPLDCNGGRRDPIAGLCWSSFVTPSAIYSWQESFDYCDTLDVEGHADWRLPALSEFTDILDNCDGDVTSGKDGHCDPCKDSPRCESLFGTTDFPDRFWTSSSNADEANGMWAVRPKCGYVRSLDKTDLIIVNYSNRRCVRE